MRQENRFWRRGPRGWVHVSKACGKVNDETSGNLVKTYIRKRLSRVCFELELAVDEATELSALALECHE